MIDAGEGVENDLGVISLQPAFVEGIEPDGESFSDLGSAFRHIFRRNREFGILLWSGVPVRIDYRDDLPVMVEPLLEMLAWVHDGSGYGTEEHVFSTANLETRWRVIVGEETVDVDATWSRVVGGYEASLNAVEPISMTRGDFLAEWKLLLKQLVTAFADADARLTGPRARDRMAAMEALESAIDERGRFYRY